MAWDAETRILTDRSGEEFVLAELEDENGIESVSLTSGKLTFGPDILRSDAQSLGLALIRYAKIGTLDQ